MRIIFFGSDPWFSPPVLEALAAAGHEILLVVSKGEVAAKFKVQSSCPTSHGRSPGGRAKFKIIQTKTDGDITRERLDSLIRPGLAAAARPGLSKPNVIVLAAFGPPFLPAEVLNWPKYGCLNVHASLLPRWRGASPVFGAIAAGDKETGVSIMKMTEEIDLGNILEQKAIQINQPSKNNSAPAVRSPLPWSPSTRRGVATAGFGRTSDFSDEKSGSSEKPYDTRETLTKKLGILGGKLIVETLKKLQNGQINEVKQPSKSPTLYTHRLTKASGRINWDLLPGETSPERSRRIERFIRAVTPWPGAQTRVKFRIQNSEFRIDELKILRAHLGQEARNKKQETMELAIDEVQLPGKNPISWKQFLAGHPDAKFE